MTESFDATIEAVLCFARLDAARFRLRDSLRAQALIPLIKHFESSYIEAVEIHYIFRIFATGGVALSSQGMESIARQLAEKIPDDRIRTGPRVESIRQGSVRLSSQVSLLVASTVVCRALKRTLQQAAVPPMAGFTERNFIYFLIRSLTPQSRRC